VLRRDVHRRHVRQRELHAQRRGVLHLRQRLLQRELRRRRLRGLPRERQRVLGTFAALQRELHRHHLLLSEPRSAVTATTPSRRKSFAVRGLAILFLFS
jgi:hypothetical protein